MEDPMQSSIIPHNLVMSYMRCDYCGKVETRVATIFHNYGCKSCDLHYELAKRDCRAYLHEHSMVMITDPSRNNIVDELVLRLKSTFVVKRTSGELQDGWKIRMRDGCDNTYIFKLNTHWAVPCLYGSENSSSSITKNVKIIDMEHIFSKLFISDILAVLDSGLYLNDFLETRNQEPHQEFPYIETVIVDGVQVRALSVPEDLA